MRKEKINLDMSGLKLFSDSPDAGDPDCLCSACGEVIPDNESEPGPIRLWPGGDKEYRLHGQCYEKRMKK